MPKRLVTRRVDDEQAGQLERILLEFGNHLALLLDHGDGHIRGTDLLRDAARLSVLRHESSVCSRERGGVCRQIRS